MVDFERKILLPKDRIRVPISDLEHNKAIVASISVGTAELDTIDKISDTPPSYSTK